MKLIRQPISLEMDFEFNGEVKSRWVSHETFWETGEEGVKGYKMKAGIVISISL